MPPRAACGSLPMAVGPGLGAGKNNNSTMLTALTTGLRFRFAILLAAFASLCFVARPAALAFGHGTADCMAHADMVDYGKVAAAPT